MARKTDGEKIDELVTVVATLTERLILQRPMSRPIPSHRKVL